MMLTALALFALPRAIADDIPNLELRLQTDDSWVQTVRQSFYLPGEKELDHAFIFENGKTVIESKSAEFTLQESRRFVESWIGEMRVPAPAEAKPIVEQVTAMRTGELSTGKRLYPSATEFRLVRLLWFVAPTATGAMVGQDSWSVTYPQAPGGSVPEARATWTLRGSAIFRSRRVLRVGLDFAEIDFPKPISGKGELLVDAETGVALKSSLSLKGAKSPGGEEILDATIESVATTFKRNGKELLSAESGSIP